MNETPCVRVYKTAPGPVCRAWLAAGQRPASLASAPTLFHLTTHPTTFPCPQTRAATLAHYEQYFLAEAGTILPAAARTVHLDALAASLPQVRGGAR